MNQRTFQLPAGFFAAFRDTLAEGRSGEEAARLFRQAGYTTGESVDAALGRWLGVREHVAVADMRAADFWNALDAFFQSLGWGSLRYSSLHPGVAALDSPDWIEAEAGTAFGCHFSEGLLADLLGRLAAGTVAVLEVECRSRGAERCRHLFGGETALGAVYHEMQSGRSYTEALDRLDS